MATLTVQNIRRASDGLLPTYTAAAGGGDVFTANQTTFLHVKNGGGGSINVTVSTPALVLDELPIDDPVVSVSAGGERMLGPYPPGYFGDATTGLATVTYSGVTSVTVAAIHLNQP